MQHEDPSPEEKVCILANFVLIKAHLDALDLDMGC